MDIFEPKLYCAGVIETIITLNSAVEIFWFMFIQPRQASKRTKYPVFIWFIINFLTQTMIRQNAAPGSSPALHICPEAKIQFTKMSERFYGQNAVRIYWHTPLGQFSKWCFCFRTAVTRLSTSWMAPLMRLVTMLQVTRDLAGWSLAQCHGINNASF